MESWRFRSGDYICNKLFKNPTSERFPLVNALMDDFNSDKDKNGNTKPLTNGKEFDAAKEYARLNMYCAKLDFLDKHWWPISRKELALLQFARVMAEHEKEWKSWHTTEFQSPLGPQAHFYEVKATINDRATVLRQDQNSPHYKWCTITKELREQDPYLYITNSYENTAFHDELKFLQTQQHKMELYWNMKSFWEKIFSYGSYKKQHELLKREIAVFKKDNNRPAFTRSCMQNKDFVLLQQARDAYRTAQVRQTE